MGAESDLVMHRWRRYGKDRLYVEHPDGTTVGYWDLVADIGHPTAPEHQHVLFSAVEDWKVRQVTGTPVAAAPAAESEPSWPVLHTLGRDQCADLPAGAVIGSALVGKPVDSDAIHDSDDASGVSATEPVRPWIDLATNRAGEAAREQAVNARDAAPVRTAFARILGVHTDERAWRIGADGEEKVAAKIDKAMRKDPRWRVLHAIPIGRRSSDIDHLVVGPGGVFTVNAKHHPGAKIWVGGNTFLVDGYKQPYVRNSRYEAARAAKLLTAAAGFPVHVEGLIVTVNAKDVVIKSQPEGVHVTWRNNLANWLLRLGPALAEDHIEAVYGAARRSTTWCP